MVSAGLVFSVASGLILPAQIVLFGEMVDLFFLHSAATSEVGNTSVSLLAQSTALALNMSCDRVLAMEQFVENVSNSDTILCKAAGQETFGGVVEFACDPKSRLRSEIGIFSLYFVGLGAVALVAGFLGALFWNISAYRQTRRIRESLYQSILRQEVGWFDVNNALGLNTRLIE